MVRLIALVGPWRNRHPSYISADGFASAISGAVELVTPCFSLTNFPQRAGRVKSGSLPRFLSLSRAPDRAALS
jgi:hypothetical protein